MSYLFVLLGLVFLLFGGDYLVKGAVSLALKLQVSTMVIGLTVVAFATSAPELLVSMEAALNNHTDITLGNVVGSNIANIGLILGFTAMVFTLPALRIVYFFDWLFMVAITLLMYFILRFYHEFDFVTGAVFMVILIGYNFHKIRSSRIENKKIDLEVDETISAEPLWKVLLFILLGVLGLRFGAQFFVEGAADIALNFGISERVISVTMVAFGTSVPELVASIMAARRNEKDLAIGNLIGSNIFNILAVIGITSLITKVPLQDPALITFDFWWMLGFSVLLLPLIGMIKKHHLGRVEGAILFVGYVLYITLVFLKM